MITQEELNSSLPEGYVRLGLGRGIVLGSERLSQGIAHSRQEGSEWTTPTDWSFTHANTEYAVRNTSPMVNLNLDLVREYNPNWRSLLPDDWIPPIPNGWLRAGRGPLAVPESGWMGEGKWIEMGSYQWNEGSSVGFQRRFEYLVPENSPLIPLNLERIISLNPNFSITLPEEPTPTQQMFTPLPDGVPRPPSGYLIFSNGGRNFPDQGNFDSDEFLRLELSRGIREWREVNYGVSPNSPGNWWAVREGSAIAVGHEERIAFYNPPAPNNTEMRVNGIELSPAPTYITPPEGWLLMGQGAKLSSLLGQNRYQGIRWRGDHQGGVWSDIRECNIGSEYEWFACEPGDPFVQQYPEWIQFYNPGFQSGVASTQEFRPLEEGLETVPQNYFIIGHSDDLPNRTSNCLIYYPSRDPGEKWWNGRWNVGPNRGNPFWIACRIDSPLYNEERANFYNQPTVRTNPIMVTSRNTTRPYPEGMRTLPDDVHVMGDMSAIQCTARGVDGFYACQNMDWERRIDGFGHGYNSNYWFALHVDSPHYNPELAALYPVNNTNPRIPGPHLHTLSVNGTPISSFEELQSVAEPLMIPEENSKVLGKIWESLEYDDPEVQIESFIEKQPVLMGVIAFHEMERPVDVLDVTSIAESTRSVGEIITRAAAGALLRGGLSNHFNYTDGGVLQINPDSPPTLDQAHEIIRRTLEIRETAERLDNYSAWTLGMLGDQLETFFGEEFDVSVVMESSKKSYNTYITAVGTYRALWNEKRGNLSFTHHKEVFYAKIDAEQKNWVLDKASELSLSVADTRKLTSYVRNYGTEGLDENPPGTPEELIERVEVKSVNKNYLFFLPSENKWFEYRGPFERIPNGATPIFNADTRKRLNIDGTTQNLDTWTPAGIEMPYIRGHAAIAARSREESGAPVEVEATQAEEESAQEQFARALADGMEVMEEMLAPEEEDAPGIIIPEEIIESAESRLTEEALDRVYRQLTEDAATTEPLVDPRAIPILEEMGSTDLVHRRRRIITEVLSNPDDAHNNAQENQETIPW